MTHAAEAAVAPRPLVRLFGREKGFPLGALLAGLGLTIGVLVRVLGLDHLPYTFCGLKAFTGIPCPTCGTTRTLGCLAHFDLPGAIAMNPLVGLGALAVVPWALADLVLMPRGRSLAVEVSPPVARAVRIAIVASLLLNWIYLIAAGR